MISTASWSFRASDRVKVFPSVSVAVTSGNGFPRNALVSPYARAPPAHSAGRAMTRQVRIAIILQNRFFIFFPP